MSASGKKGMPLKPLIHPGFHKTGTSWLQANVFANSEHFDNFFDHEQAELLFCRPHDLEFDPVETRTACAAHLSHCSNKIPVLSSEILSGLIFTGSTISATVARRLKSSFDEARILFTVRAQVPMVRSIYSQYIKRGGRLSLERFLNYQPEYGYSWFNRDVVRFDRLVSYYAELFGAGNVLVLPQELLARDQDEFCNLLIRFASDGAIGSLSPNGARNEGVSPPASGTALIRAGNLFHDGPCNPNAVRSGAFIGKALRSLGYRWKPGNDRARAKMDQIIGEWLGNGHRADNVALQRWCPVDLQPLGYDFPTAD
jgi:hypothetical protein